MSLVYVGNGGVFTRLGLDAGTVLDLLKLAGATPTAPTYSATLDTKINALAAAYAAGSTARRDISDGIFAQLTAWKGGSAGLVGYILGNTMPQTVIGMVRDDKPQSDLSIGSALAQLIVQMKADGYYVTGSTVGAGSQTNVGTPTGDPNIVISTKDAYGYDLDYMLAETLTYLVTNDEDLGATAGYEPYSVKGQVAVNPSDWRWPGGSGCNKNFQIVDPTVNATQGNLLYNSGFETSTNSNIPDNWIKAVGTIGTDILVVSSGAYSGSKALKFLGDGSTLSSVYQVFNTTPSTTLAAGGTTSVLKPNQSYPFSMKIKVDTAAAAGVLEVSFRDSSGTVLVDSAGNDCKSAKTVGGSVGTSYETWSGTLRTPAVLPSEYRIYLRLTTALTSTRGLFIDHFGLAGNSSGGPTPLYAGGPTTAMFKGATNPIKGDSWTLAMTNTYGVFQREFQRAFDMRSLGLRLPTAGLTGINDNLVA